MGLGNQGLVRVGTMVIVCGPALLIGTDLYGSLDKGIWCSGFKNKYAYCDVMRGDMAVQEEEYVFRTTR